jgi:hypothetical protein
MAFKSRNVVVIDRSYWPVSVIESLIHGKDSDVHAVLFSNGHHRNRSP